MSINPPSDIVLDVARAADPVRSSEATERLARMATDLDTNSPGFSNVLSGLPTRSAMTGSMLTQLEINSRHANTSTQPLDSETKAYRNFEALVLQNLVQNMLPDSEEFFGEGTAGMIWKSMLADQLGADLAKKVDLGIGPKHAKAHVAGLHKPDAPAPLTPATVSSSQIRS